MSEMTNENPVENEMPDFSTMSDDEFMEQGGAEAFFDEPLIEEMEEAEEVGDDSYEEPQVSDDTEETTDTDENEEVTFEAEQEESELSDEVTDVEDETTEEVESDTDEIDYKAVYEQLTKPFKANGKEIQVDNVDDAIQLMQMGANYNKKMSQLKPNLKLLKMLENNSLLDESKLSYLIDLDKKNPDAIKKLVKDANIDAFDLSDEEGGEEYRPGNYGVNDAEMALDEVLTELRDTDTYQKTIDVASKQWDEGSRSIIAQNPEVLKVINEHMGNGIYDMVSAEVEKQKMLGRLTGLSDIEAYRQVGDQMNEQGRFGTANQTQPTAQTTTPKASKPNPTVTKRKKAAASTKSTGKASSQQNIPNDIASLSDEEFEKVMAKYV